LAARKRGMRRIQITTICQISIKIAWFMNIKGIPWADLPTTDFFLAPPSISHAHLNFASSLA
jgi:hypothetical protein